ncbi:hypothetical protein FMM58_02710 [Campylobacter sp. LR291e]|nr:hypothetical protein FMM54_04770 [Campylobacter sp. LR185c]KAA6228067.1 hypothetical protein FMM57_03460 [Campylobacter sp. LR286c]KAA6231532.1 hypothetical protein FMM58_02710 [Campylobacter sp. LR291e]KAA8604619.1 hypothetical protein CGP82_01405 [Campylobacter sp. LR185c]
MFPCNKNIFFKKFKNEKNHFTKLYFYYLFKSASYGAIACSLQNLIKKDSCRPETVWNEQYGCRALPYIRVNGKPVCVD